MDQDIDHDTIEDVLDRILGAKVCLQEVLQISPVTKEHQEAFEKALDAALELEAEMSGLLA